MKVDNYTPFLLHEIRDMPKLASVDEKETNIEVYQYPQKSEEVLCVETYKDNKDCVIYSDEKTIFASEIEMAVKGKLVPPIT